MQLMDLKERNHYMFRLAEIVKDVGPCVLEYNGEIIDPEMEDKFEGRLLQNIMGGFFERAIAQYLPRFSGIVQHYHRCIETNKTDNKEDYSPYVLLVHDLTGFANTRRKLKNKWKYNVPAAVSITLYQRLKNKEKLIVLASACYTLDTKETLSSKLGEMDRDSGNLFYESFCEGELLEQKDFLDRNKGDDKNRLIVVDYDNQNQLGIGEIKQALVNNGIGVVYGGTRTNLVDIINVTFRQQYDACIDPRALWHDSGFGLCYGLCYYDVAAILPFAQGLDYHVTDIHGNPIEYPYKSEGEIEFKTPFTLIVARKELGHKLVESLQQPIIETQEKWQEKKLPCKTPN